MELRRARTPSGVDNRRDEDSLACAERADSLLASDGRSPSLAGSPGGCWVVGLSTPRSPCNPFRSSSYLTCARYRRYGKGTASCSARACHGGTPLSEARKRAMTSQRMPSFSVFHSIWTFSASTGSESVVHLWTCWRWILDDAFLRAVVGKAYDDSHWSCCWKRHTI